jgi:hypothetical protein
MGANEAKFIVFLGVTWGLFEAFALAAGGVS